MFADAALIGVAVGACVACMYALRLAAPRTRTQHKNHTTQYGSDR